MLLLNKEIPVSLRSPHPSPSGVQGLERGNCRAGNKPVPAFYHSPLSPSQIVNLIEETGHFNVTNTTFDFDLFSLDETTVRKLQSYLEAVAT